MNWVYFTSGFRESRGKDSGTKDNFRKVRDLYQSNNCCVVYNEYNDEPKKYATDLASQWMPGDTLIVCGYSWGCGKWVKRFLWKLYKINPEIRVDYLILIDPVYYSFLLSFKWLAMTDFGTIKLPGDINKCTIFHQEVNRPRSSNVKFAARNVDVRLRRLNYSHQKIDNAPEITNHVMRVAKRYIK